VEVENITGVGLTPLDLLATGSLAAESDRLTWRTAQQQTHLTVGNSLLCQIVVDDERVLAIVTEPRKLMLAE
jgi:hypothetical protein